MTIRRRTFPEVLENLLTSITGGVAAESHPFPPQGVAAPPYRHSLQQPPVRDVTAVYGSRDGKPHLFRKETDFRLLDDQQTLQWQAAGRLPDEGTLFQVNYYPTAAQPTLTDIHTGSVVRTLCESVSLEIARLYAQLEAVYQSGFIDTAAGSPLDNVVALLGITRVRGGRPVGEVEFSRSPGSRGTINIPAGTRVITSDGNVEYETTESVTLAEGQNSIRTTARDMEANDPLPADALVVLPVPIAGIAAVTNGAPTAISTQEETDVELRTRAKNFLHGSERATLGAIKAAIARQGITADVEEMAGTPGFIEITPHAESLPPELHQRLLQAIEDSRPAGVFVTLKGVVQPRKVNLEIRLTTTTGLLQQDLRAIQREVRKGMKDYFSRLPAKESGSVNKIIGTALGVAGVEDVRVVSAAWDDSGGNVLDREKGTLDISGCPTVLGELHIADPNLPTLLSATVSYPEDEGPPDSTAVKAALADAMTYVNSLNANEDLDATLRTLSLGKLLRVIPLPGKPGASLQDYDSASASGSPPALPDESTILPYVVRFVFTLESGLSRILVQGADSYTLTPFERISVNSVETRGEATDA